MDEKRITLLLNYSTPVNTPEEKMTDLSASFPSYWMILMTTLAINNTLATGTTITW